MNLLSLDSPKNAAVSILMFLIFFRLQNKLPFSLMNLLSPDPASTLCSVAEAWLTKKPIVTWKVPCARSGIAGAVTTLGNTRRPGITVRGKKMTRFFLFI